MIKEVLNVMLFRNNGLNNISAIYIKMELNQEYVTIVKLINQLQSMLQSGNLLKKSIKLIQKLLLIIKILGPMIKDQELLNLML